MDRTRFLGVALLGCLALAGCGRADSASAPTKAPEVVVSQPVVKQITDFEDYTGRTEAVASVEVRARVTGYLDKVLFKEGAEVKLGDRLFEIDPSTYKAEVKRMEATLRQVEAHLKRLQFDYKRAVPLLPNHAISQEDFDKIVGDRDEAEAAVKLAEASLDLARLNMGFATVIAPISGRISRQLIDPGNMVKADETVLTTIVTLDPIYAYFDVDERSVLKFRRLMEAGRVKSSRDSVAPVQMGLLDEQDEKGNPLFPHAGIINFVDNRLESMTGTLRLRGRFDNPKYFLAPGLFARIRVPIGSAHSAILVSEQAFGSDQGQRFVYVVNDKNEIEYRRVKVGPLQDGFRVAEQGLAEKDRVVVSGLQRVRPGMKVEPKPAERPAQASVSPAGAGRPSPGSAKP